jgi:hypothetical protein
MAGYYLVIISSVWNVLLELVSRTVFLADYN